MSSTSLPIAPEGVSDEAGAPRFGSYRGGLPEVSFRELAGSWRPGLPALALQHKRWLYTFVATPEVLAVYAVADLSYTANAFVLVVDLREKRVLVDRGFLGFPGPLVKVNDCPGEGLDVSFTGPAGRLAASRGEGEARYRQRVDLFRYFPLPKRELAWEGKLLAAGGPPPLTVIAPVSGGGLVNVTQKWAGLLAFGSLRAGGRTYLLDGGVGGLDYTHGILARQTTWQWAFACGRLADGTPLGLNLVEGFNDGEESANENAVWVGRELLPLPRVRFELNRGDFLDDWKVRSVDGAVDLRFRPICAHREMRDYKVVRSRFVQPAGTWSGTVVAGGRRLVLEGIPGVTEDQDVLW